MLSTFTRVMLDDININVLFLLCKIIYSFFLKLCRNFPMGQVVLDNTKSALVLKIELVGFFLFF